VKVLKHRERIDKVGTAVIVTHDGAEQLRKGLLHDLDITYPVLIDLSMQSYRDWGLGHAQPAQTYLSPKVILGYAKRIFLEGEKPRLGTEPLQLGGDFVIGVDGSLVYSHPQQAVNDRPPTALLVRALEQAAAQPSYEQLQGPD
jgi:hypothetical protein